MTIKMSKIKKVKIPSILDIIVLIMGILIISISFIVLLIIIYLLSVLLDTIFENVYQNFLIANRKSKRWCKALFKEELEMVEDAKELIKKVDNSITISEFNVYKVRFVTEGWFYYDEDTDELNIFIPFEYFLGLGGKDLCFLAVLHEILHSQNLKNNIQVFKEDFLEGMNQLLTEWLIENYSEKYKIPKSRKFVLKRINHLKEDVPFKIYQKETSMVKDILEKSGVDLKQVFLNYIAFQPEFFRKFIPKKYLEKQK